MRVVVKIGTSSVTTRDGDVNSTAIDKLCADVANATRMNHEVVIVTSGAITAGLQTLKMERPTDSRTLQAVSAVGQIELMRVYRELLDRYGLVAGQALLAPLDFTVRKQYVHARGTVERLLEMGVTPVINENDAIADDEIRFGDNDRLAALVANLIGAELLVLLTDAPGLLTADPRLQPDASLIEEITRIDSVLEDIAGEAGSSGSGGMAAKLAAAKMATWTGVRVVIAAANRPGVLQDAIDGRPGVGTIVHPQDRKLSARKLWIAFAVPSQGRIVVDQGARHALVEGAKSLLPAGLVDIVGDFGANSAVDIVLQDGEVFAKGIAKLSSSGLRATLGMRTTDLPDGVIHETVHRDDLVVLVET